MGELMWKWNWEKVEKKVIFPGVQSATFRGETLLKEMRGEGKGKGSQVKYIVEERDYYYFHNNILFY